MNRKKQRFLFFPILLILLALVPSNGFASEFNFAVTPIPSEKQVDKEKTYFDLLLEPNEETELKVNLRNDTDKEVK
ncbi:WxL protein peptidoglycan domain-containing protein, partial [Enterococcus faecalis]